MFLFALRHPSALLNFCSTIFLYIAPNFSGTALFLLILSRLTLCLTMSVYHLPHLGEFQHSLCHLAWFHPYLDLIVPPSLQHAFQFELCLFCSASTILTSIVLLVYIFFIYIFFSLFFSTHIHTHTISPWLPILLATHTINNIAIL